jgi:hypothetical protein
MLQPTLLQSKSLRMDYTTVCWTPVIAETALLTIEH